MPNKTKTVNNKRAKVDYQSGSDGVELKQGLAQRLKGGVIMVRDAQL